ncbi:MAG: hypothetical protein QW514_00960 [Thermoprotei archaeon]
MNTPDYCTIDSRVNRLRMDIDDSFVKSNSLISIAVDSSGIKVRNIGDWISRWKVEKGYLNIYFAVDMGSGLIVSMGVSGRGGDGGGWSLRSLVRKAQEKVGMGKRGAGQCSIWFEGELSRRAWDKAGDQGEEGVGVQVQRRHG